MLVPSGSSRGAVKVPVNRVTKTAVGYWTHQSIPDIVTTCPDDERRESRGPG
jgi:hypothetical protein